MRFAAIAAVVACAAAHEAVFLADETTAEPTAEQKCTKFLEDNADFSDNIKEMCPLQEKKSTNKDGEEEMVSDFDGRLACFNKNLFLAQGKYYVAKSEEKLADESGDVKTCGTEYSSSNQKQPDFDRYFACVSKAGKSNAAYPEYTKALITNTFSAEIVAQGETYCSETKKAFDSDPSSENADKLASCYRGVAKGGSATVFIIILLALVGCAAGGIYCYNKRQRDSFKKPDEEEV